MYVPACHSLSAVYPLSAVAIAANGQTYVTPPLVTIDSYAIRNVYQTPAGATWTIRLYTQPRITLTTLTVCIDAGLNGATRGTHPADGTWSVAATSDPFIYELLGSVGDSTSVFTDGHAYIPGSLSTTRVGIELNNAGSWLRINSGGTIILPNGGMYLLDRLFFPESCTVIGGGGYNTFFFFSTYAERVAANLPPSLATSLSIGSGTVITIDGVHVLPGYNNVANARWHGWTVYGYRPGQKYGVGAHAISCGADTDITGTISISIEFIDIHVIGSAGYGVSLGGHNAKMTCLFERCSFKWSDSDNFDTKNRLNENDDLLWRDCTWAYHAMGDQGTNLKPSINMPANPFTTTSGQSTVATQRNQVDKATRPGEVGTFSGATTFNGMTLNGSFPCISIDSLANTITWDASPQVANASGSGGGSAMIGTIPHISVGDVHVDLRGRRMRVLGGVADAEYWSRSGFRQRGGISSDAAGEGGTDCMMRDLTGVDHSPSWIGSSDVEGRGFVTLLGVGGSASGIVFLSEGKTVGIATGSTASFARVSDCRIVGAFNGIQNRASDCTFGPNIDIVNSTAKGVEVYGMTIQAVVALDTDPYTPSGIGSANAVVTQANHGNTPGVTTVRFSGTIQTSNGLNPIVPSNSDPPYTVQNPVTTNTFTIIVGGSCTDVTLASWGGPDVEAHYNPTPNIANNNTFIGVRTWQSAANTATGWSVGMNTGNPDGRAANTRIMACEDHGSNLPWEDAGSDTDWAGLNKSYDLNDNILTDPVALPNNIVATTVTAAGLVSAGFVLLGTYDFSINGASSSIEFHTLGAYSEIALVPRALTHGNGSTQNWQVQGSYDNATWLTSSGDYMRYGSTNASGLLFSSAVAAATPVSGWIHIKTFNLAIKQDVQINGGQDNNATSPKTNGAYFTAGTALQAVRVVNGGGVPTTGGIVYCLGKV